MTLRRAVAPALAALAGAVVLAACSGGGESLRCEEPGEYVTSRSAPPVRVPDELSVPNESGALRVPPPSRTDGGGEDEDGAQPAACLERPPDYFEGGGPQGGND